MAGELKPGQAAAYADGVYATLDSSTPSRDASFRISRSGFGGEFDIDNSTVFQGKTGAAVQSNFGFVAFGRPGPRQGEVVVAVRGTQTGADWLSNGNAAIDRSPSGFAVHQGFNQLARSIHPQVQEALKGRNPSTLHFIGHSLGGAAATILADALSAAGGVKLYTFGAPRAGYSGHTGYVTSTLGQNNIFRTYHDTDPVPMVPVFPFTHAPSPGSANLLKGTGAIISFDAHSMTNYIRSVGTADWRGLPRMPYRRFSFDTVDDVLKQAGQLPGGYLDALLMRLLVKALSMIMKGAGIVAGNIVQEGVTVLDQLVVALQHGWNFASETVEALVHQIMRFLGLMVDYGRRITAQFLRWLLDKLFAVIANMASLAINRFVR